MRESGELFATPDAATVSVIAEAGVNHNGDVDLAHQLIDVAVRSGAAAVKFQTFRSDQLAAPAAPMADRPRRSGPDSTFRCPARLR